MSLSWSRWWGGREAPTPDARRWVVVDVETTGLDTRHDELLAIAAVAVRFDGEAKPQIDLHDSFEAVLQHASASTDKDNILVHGIGVGAQRAGALPREVLADFERWLGASPLVAWHAAFDRTMIGRAMRDHLQREGPSAWLDLAPVAAGLHPEINADALDDWLAHFGIVCVARHNAAADALATAELLLRLWPRARARRCADWASWVAMERDQRWLQRV
jgi:DNA polymerase III subunit epsilon